MKLTKLEVQKRVSVSGKPIPLKDFDWCERTKTFRSDLNCLVVDFNGISDCTFNVGSSCTFRTYYGCTFNTFSNCVFNTGSDCVFNTCADCTFKTGSECVFDTARGCTFDTGSCCIFNTGSYCTFNTYYNCTFKTGTECVVVRRDTFEAIQLKEGVKTQLHMYNVKGYIEDCCLELDKDKYTEWTLPKIVSEDNMRIRDLKTLILKRYKH